MTAAPQSIQPKAESLPERLRVGSCRYAHETQDDAAKRRIATDLEAADRIEKLEALLNWLDNLGGLGYEKHNRIRAALSPNPAGETGNV